MSPVSRVWAQYGHIADHHHLDVVALLIHTEVIEPNSGGLPDAAADALNAESFTAQVLCALDSRASDEIEILAAAQARDDFYISATDGCRQCSWRARHRRFGYPRMRGWQFARGSL